MAKFCKYCGTSIESSAAFCTNCGAKIDKTENNGGNTSNPSLAHTGEEAKSRVAAGLLGIFTGGFGFHNFYLGYTSRGVIQIIVSIFTCGLGSLWGFIEGILILCGVINTDADGIALKD